jgi:hypothetical protein
MNNSIPIEIILDALQDTVHIDKGTKRTVKAIKKFKKEDK